MSHSHDDANRLLEDDAYSYVYDANGNLVTKTDKATGDVTTYTWDSLDRLIQITFPDTTTATYAYDAFGRRIEKNVNGTVTRYLYDGWDILAEFDGTGTLLAKYSHGPYVDHPLVMERAGQTYYFHAGQDGSISHVTDASGAVVNEYIYDAFGNRISVTETVSNPYGFTAREYDSESGLYFYRARYYDPKAGRFISSDPIGFAGGDSNLYAYVFNDPANLVDPSGLADEPPDWRDKVKKAGLRGFAICNWLRISTALAAAAFAAEDRQNRGLEETGFYCAPVKPTIRCSNESASTKPPIIIGERMGRVQELADALGADVYKPWPNHPWDPELGMKRNERWIKDKIREGRDIWDVGPDFPRRRGEYGDPFVSPFYEMERRVVEGYCNYRKLFEREGNSGNVPELESRK